ncbi:MAG TPA: hypothetical protein VG474_05885 [Solirubrobacteraceae bacterium]|nr:hypothetical protein [Solirubrobacteraceae bacterium]
MPDPGEPGERGDAGERPQDPYVERRRPDPSQPPEPTKTLAGVLGDSDRPGFRRLYFTAELDYYAEFRTEDVVALADVPPAQPPFLGEPATRVTLRRDAAVDFTRTQRARPLDEFDLDVRLAAAPAAPLAASTFGCGDTEFFGCTQFCTMEAQCAGPTRDIDCGPPPTRGCETVQITICRGATCLEPCDTRIDTLCDQQTCVTCRTCGEATCQATCRTCNTACGQATCATCNTACGQATCRTCQTRCNQATCRTCETRCGGTCNPHVFTCGNQRQCLGF